MTTTRVILTHPWRNNEKLSKSEHLDNDVGLSEFAVKIAQKELREDKLAREQCLQHMRNWLVKNDEVREVRKDDMFLLRYLRAKKFSVPMAQQLLLKYLNLRRHFPEMSTNLDFLSPPMQQIFSQGYLFASPIRDQYGRRVIFARAEFFDPYVHSSQQQARAHFIALETLLEDPENQVLGFTHVCDMSGIRGAHVTNWRPADFTRILKWGEQSFPARHKAIHCINIPSKLKFVMELAKSTVSNKIKDRFTIYSNIADFNKKIDKACLPREMGGTIPAAEMIKMWSREMAAKREILLDLDKMKLVSDKSIITKLDKNNNTDISTMEAHCNSIAGSFRKLEVD